MTARLGYARVSTAQQELQPYRDRLESAGCGRVFEDLVSGRSFDRPGLAAILDYARPADAVCVVRLDRLGRSLRELLDTVQMLKDRGVGFVSLEERLDTVSAAGELVFHMFGAIAHFERRPIAERTRDGLAAAQAGGAKPGRPAVDAEKLSVVRTLVAAGLSPTRAVAQVGLGRSTVYRELQLPPLGFDPEQN